MADALDKIIDRMLQGARRSGDSDTAVNDAVRRVQRKIGQRDGDVAGTFFDPRGGTPNHDDTAQSPGESVTPNEPAPAISPVTVSSSG